MSTTHTTESTACGEHFYTTKTTNIVHVSREGDIIIGLTCQACGRVKFATMYATQVRDQGGDWQR